MNVLQDFRFAARSLRAHFGTALFATLTLAGVAVLLLGTVLRACLVPARKACTVAPRAALN